MYIALKNTEHKGVYKKEDWKEEWQIKGASFREFDNLDEAKEWAGVKGLKENKPKNKGVKEVRPMVAKSKSEQVLEIINAVSVNADKGVCISTRSMGDIIFIPNPLYILNTMDTYGKLQYLNEWTFVHDFEKMILCDASDMGYNYIDFEYNILKMPRVSTVRAVNDSFLELNDCWGKPSDCNIAEDEYLNIDHLYYFKRYDKDVRGEIDYSSRYFLNADEVIGVKEIDIVSGSDLNVLIHFGEQMYNGYTNFNICISEYQYKELKLRFNRYDVEDVNEEEYDFGIEY